MVLNGIDIGQAITVGFALFGAISGLVRAIPTKDPKDIENAVLRVVSTVFQGTRIIKK